MLTWQQITGAARYGTDLIAYTPYSERFIKKDIRHYLCHGNNIGRTLDSNPEILDINVKIHDAPRSDFSLSVKNISNFNPLDMIQSVKGLSPAGVEKSSVEIKYKYKIPRLLRIAGREYLTIKSKSEVLSGDASAGYKKRRGS
jgi:hypothetical protein